MKKYILLLYLFSFIHPFQCQVQLSAYSEISLVTVGPGTELHEAFGHSAIRIKDPILQLDIVYNYGIFDFNQPNFELNFTKGKMLYSLGRYPFKNFIENYKIQKRWLQQQVLNLNQQQRQAFFVYLENNAQPKNANYFYDPYYNNCATKLRDATSKVLGNKVTFRNTHLKEKQSLRQLMNKEIAWNTWGSLGINIALGSKLDKIASPSQYMYLPDYLYKAFENAKITTNKKTEKLIKKNEILVDFKELEQKILFFNPLLIFSLLMLIGLYFTYKDFNNNTRAKWLDFVLFFTTGCVGFIIVFLWFFTDHSTTPNNFNFLWAFAPNFFASFFLLKKSQSKWMQKYILLLLIFLISIPIIWLTKIQQLPISIIPLLLLLAIRYTFLFRRK